jgi:hypothetical protein
MTYSNINCELRVNSSGVYTVLSLAEADTEN